MKPSLFALLFPFVFLTTSAVANFVDTDGNIVQNGRPYYILPYIWALGGGVELAKTGNETCPLSVVQSPSEVDNGLPWVIMSPLRIVTLRTGMPVDFFSVEGKVPSCVPKWSSWTIIQGENGIKSVELGSRNGRTGRAPMAPFKFLKYNNWAYKIMYCTTIDDDYCEDVGISRDEQGNRRLVLSHGNPLPVVVTKAENSQSGIAQVV